MSRPADRTEYAQRQRFGLLLVVLLAAFVVQGAVQPARVQGVVVTLLLGAALVIALWCAQMRPGLLWAAGAVAVAVAVLSVVHAAGAGVGDGPSRVANAVLVLLAPPAVVLGVVRSLRRHRSVRIDAVLGVICLYLLLGMLWAFVYGAIDRLGGAPFFTGGHTATVSHCLYFSFITMTTVGYGDYTARSDLGHTLAALEALLGQIYLVTVVSVIVGNLGRPRGERPLQRAAEDEDR